MIAASAIAIRRKLLLYAIIAACRDTSCSSAASPLTSERDHTLGRGMVRINSLNGVMCSASTLRLIWL